MTERSVRAPAWLAIEVLPGGFTTGLYLAGGEVLEWEREAFQIFGVESRAELNRFFLSERGRNSLLEHRRDGSYRIDHSEEAALIVAAGLPPDHDLVKKLEPYLGEVRFYPRLLSARIQDPPFGMLYRESCEEVLRSLESYQLPLDILRKREALTLWRPFLFRMVEQIRETTEEGWPFQSFPAGWERTTAALVGDIETALEKRVVCCFPRRADSDFSRLLLCLKTALKNPTGLDGKDVSFCKSRVEDSQKKWGPIPFQSATVPPGQDVLQALPRLKQRLAENPGPTGLDDGSEFFQSIPAALGKKLAKCRLGSLDELKSRGLLGTCSVLAQLAPQLVSGVFAGPERSLLRRCYLAYSRSTIATPFQELPWIAAIWGAPNREIVETAVRLLLESWWNNFPHQSAPKELDRQIETLVGWIAHPADYVALAALTQPNVDFGKAKESCMSYTLQLQSASCPKPYQRQQREKRLQACARNQAMFKELLFSGHRP